MKNENHWSKFADNFEEKNNYVAGKKNIDEIKHNLLLQNLQGNGLELGCGNGTYSPIIAQNAKSLMATDISDEMITVSNKKLIGLTKVMTKKEDCFSLSFPDEYFDFIVMVNLLHVIPSPEKAILESKRVLKAGGVLVVASFTMEKMNILNRLKLIHRYLRAYGKPPIKTKQLNIKRATSIIEKHGFLIEQANLIGKEVHALFIRSKKCG